jgi:DNA polymerase III epsilon subunit family exonuclease
MGIFDRLFGASPVPASDIPPPAPGDMFVVVDFETTGLTAERDKIIEIGAIRVNPSKADQATYDALIDPGVRIPKNITEITGITNEMIRASGQRLDDVLRDFKAFVGELPMVGYNVAFDTGFLLAAAAETGIRIKSPKVIDVMELAKEQLRLRSYKLSAVAKHLRIPATTAHRALADCVTTLHVYDRLLAQQPD